MSKRLWFVRIGPCWCSGRPRGTLSFDVARLRSTPLPLGVGRDIVVSPRDVTQDVAHALAPVLERGAVLAIHRPCPGADAVDPSVLVALPGAEDVFIDECVTGHPDLLVAALAAHWSRQSRPVAV